MTSYNPIADTLVLLVKTLWPYLLGFLLVKIGLLVFGKYNKLK